MRWYSYQWELFSLNCCIFHKNVFYDPIVLISYWLRFAKMYVLNVSNVTSRPQWKFMFAHLENVLTASSCLLPLICMSSRKQDIRPRYFSWRVAMPEVNRIKRGTIPLPEVAKLLTSVCGSSFHCFFNTGHSCSTSHGRWTFRLTPHIIWSSYFLGGKSVSLLA